MEKVVISKSVFNAMMEQLGYWADYCDDSEGYLAGLLEEVSEEVSEEASKPHRAFTKEEYEVRSAREAASRFRRVI